MGKHHHHPHEGHSSGNPPKRPRHTWFFYLAGLFILLALLAFIFSGNLAFRPTAPVAPAPSVTK